MGQAGKTRYTHAITDRKREKNKKTERYLRYCKDREKKNRKILEIKIEKGRGGKGKDVRACVCAGFHTKTCVICLERLFAVVASVMCVECSGRYLFFFIFGQERLTQTIITL